MLINSEQQSHLLSRKVLGGYIEQTEPEPSGELPEQIAPPDDSSIGAHMAYAVQWWLFVAAVPVGWIILVRREKRDREEAAASNATADAPEQPEPASA
ncbi:SURF1-like protein [Streptomyces badius]